MVFCMRPDKKIPCWGISAAVFMFGEDGAVGMSDGEGSVFVVSSAGAVAVVLVLFDGVK